MTDSSEGPTIEIKWTFPLIRTVSEGRVREILRSRNIPERVKESTPTLESSHIDDEESEEDNEQDERMDDLKNQISELRSSGGGDLSFSQTAEEEADVTYNGSVFAPVRATKEVEGTVRWTNNSDEAINILSTDAPEDFDLTIESDDVGAVQLSEEGVYQYRISDEPVEELCGAVVVGDVESPDSLPCEEDLEREVFEVETNSFAEAAESKTRSFND